MLRPSHEKCHPQGAPLDKLAKPQLWTLARKGSLGMMSRNDRLLRPPERVSLRNDKGGSQVRLFSLMSEKSCLTQIHQLYLFPSKCARCLTQREALLWEFADEGSVSSK